MQLPGMRVTRPTEKHLTASSALITQAAATAKCWVSYLDTLNRALGSESASIELRRDFAGVSTAIATVSIDNASVRVPLEPRLLGLELSCRDAIDKASSCSRDPGVVEGTALPKANGGGLPAPEARTVPQRLLFKIAEMPRAAAEPPGDGPADGAADRDLATLLELAGHAQARAHATIDAGGRLVEVSPAFAEIVAASETLSIHNGQLAPLHGDDRREIESLIAALFSDDPPDAPLPIRLCPRSGGHGLVLRMARLAAGAANLSPARPVALVTLTDLDATGGARTGDLRALWGLTEREAELAVRLAQGERIERAARELGIGEGTARHHLKSIFRRMDIDRQVDLVRLVAQIGS
jgi:DNA-binding CsgD family transcriptional regulator